MIDEHTMINVVVIVGGVIANAAYFKGKIEEGTTNTGKRIDGVVKSIDELKEHVRYTDTCDAAMDGHDKRLNMLETRG